MYFSIKYQYIIPVKANKKGRLLPSLFVYLCLLHLKNFFFVILFKFNGCGESCGYIEHETIASVLPCVKLACFGCDSVPCINGFFAVVGSLACFLAQVCNDCLRHRAVEVAVVHCVQVKLVGLVRGVVDHRLCSFHGVISFSLYGVFKVLCSL